MPILLSTKSLLSILLLSLTTAFSALAQSEDALEPLDTLNVGHTISPPFIYHQNGQLQGPSLWLLEKLAEEHNLVYRLQEMPLDSLLHGLEMGTVDISASPLTITSDRLQNINFSPPYYIAHSAILVPQISSTEKAVEFLASFFSLNFFRALGALAVVILVFGLLVWVFERKNNNEEFGNGIHGLWHGFWWSAVTMTTVGYGDKSPQTAGGRVVALIWMFTAIIIISGFTASIASSLTVNQIGATASTIEDFKEKRLATVRQSGTERWLRDNFYSNLATFEELPQMVEALEKKQVGAVAYDRPLLQNIEESDSLSRFQVLDIKYNPQFYAMGIRRGFPENLKQQFAISIMRHIESQDWKVRLVEYGLKE